MMKSMAWMFVRVERSRTPLHSRGRGAGKSGSPPPCGRLVQIVVLGAVLYLSGGPGLARPASPAPAPRVTPRTAAPASAASATAASTRPATSAPPAPASTAPIKVREQWFDFLFHGSKVGFVFSRDEPSDIDGKPVIHSYRWSVITVRRQDEVIRMESATDAWFEPSGAPVRFKNRRREGGETRNTEGYRDGSMFVLRRDIGGNASEERLKLDSPLLLASSLEVIFGVDLRLGKSMQGKAILEDESQVVPFSMSVDRKEKGPEGEVFVVSGELAGLKSTTKVLPSGESLVVELPVLGAKFVRTTRERAMQVESPVDIFSSAMFSVEQPLPRGSQLERLVVRLRSKSGKLPPHIADARQRVRRVGPDTIELDIRTDEPPLRSVRRPISGKPARIFLKETPYEALRDERLVAAVEKVVEDVDDGWTAAKRINSFVHRHIEKKSLARAFASATEAFESREGDCTEHAVLFSALAKIAGVPTRLATGLVYVGGDGNLFGYHEWVEVWMGDRWIAMDPTFGQDLADPTHIKFSEGQSDSDGLRDAGTVAASLIGNLELSVVKFEVSS